MFSRFVSLYFFCFIFIITAAQAQTDFAPGQIMFTGYNSDDPDGFSFVILTDIVDGTVIYITDRGWSSTTGFRDDTDGGEGTLKYEFTEDYPCGTTFILQDVGTAPNVWLATDEYGGPTGIVTILTSTTESTGQDPQGIEFNAVTFPSPADGDQLFIYQLPEPNPGNQTAFVTGIHMNGGAWNASNADDYSSQQPTGLTNTQVVRFNTEVDNAKYDCSPVTGTSLALQAAIENDNGVGGLISDAANNWNESNNFQSLLPSCHFCCGATAPASAPIILSPPSAFTNQVFTIIINGTLAGGASWELYSAGCGVGAPIQTTTSSSFNIVAPSTAGVYTYYVRSSQVTSCEAICAAFQISVCASTNLNTCTNCSANPASCGDCWLPPPTDNPDLDSGCYEIKLIFVLDESGSIGNNWVDVRDGVLAFLNSLNGQDIQMALVEFASEARLVTNYTTINNGLILSVQGYFNGVPFNGQTYNPFNPGGSGAGTNWHDAMIKADALATSDILMFFTDGIPTGWNTSWNDCGNGSTTQTPEIVNPVKLANKIKGEDTHMFMLGVGSGIDAENLQYMSGITEYEDGVNTIGTSDYSIGNFTELAEDLEDFVEDLCNSPLEIDKQLFGAVCDGLQQFRFILHNPGTESAATYIVTDDEFPSGYTNIQYLGPPGIKVRINAACQDFPEAGYPPHTNGFRWVVNSIPPLGYDTLIMWAEVLPSGDYDNFATAQGNNTDMAIDSVIDPLFVVDDIPPTIDCPGDVLLDCTESTLPANTGQATAEDPDGSSPEVTYEDEILPGPCPEAYTIHRTWTTMDGCVNSANCLQVIDVDGLAPQIDECAVTRNIEGCGTSSITGPSYSTTSAPSTVAVFENATNQGSVSTVCGTASITYIDISSGTCPVVVTRTWTISDLCGNTVSCAQTINVDDTANPAITTCAVARVIEGCGTASITGPAYSTTSAASTEAVFENATNQGLTSDGCGITAVTYFDVATGTCPVSVTRRWTITDACGNTATCNQSISVDDNVLPSLAACAVTRNIEGCGTGAITNPVYSTTLATSSEAVFESAPNLGSISDGCGINLVRYIDVATGTCPIVVTRTWTLSDACGNSATCTQTINVDDTVLPVVNTCAVTRNIPGCNTAAITGPVFSTVPTASSEAVFENGTNLGSIADACGITSVMYVDVAAGTCPTVVTRTWTIGDACGNTSTCAQTINITNTAPIISVCAVTRNVEGCNTSVISGPVFSTTPTASTEAVFENTTNQGSSTDGCGITSVMYVDVATGTCPTVVTRTWTVSDACGSTTTCVQTINVDDTVSPVIATCPPTRNIEGCTTAAITGPIYSTVSIASSETVFENATNQGSVSDLCGITTVNYIDVSAGTCPIVVTRTWTIIDGCGNVSTCAQTINVDDTVSPNIANCPVTRNFQGCNTTVIAGPVFSTIQANSTVMQFQNMNNQGLVSDVCGIASVTYIDVATGTCPIVVTRTWKVTDACGNTSTCNQTINVDDTVNPAITTCAVVRNIQGCSTAAIMGPVFSTTLANSTETVFENTTNQGVSSDLCGITSVTYIDVANGTCPIVVSRLWTVSDACGNSTTCTQTINVDDTVNPVISTCAVTRNIEGCGTSAITGPGYSTTSAASSESVFENGTNQGVSSDVCGITSVTYVDVAVGTCPIVVTRTWTITDACANSTTCVQTINVDDTTSPGLTCPANITISCVANTLPANTGNGAATDVCDASPAITYSDLTIASPVCPQEYTINRTWLTTDDCGNTSTCLQIITIDDSVPPVLACPANLTIECIESTLPAHTGTATTSDICDESPSLMYTDVTMAIPMSNGYQIQRTWTTSDTCGNSASCIQIIRVDNPLVPDIIGLPFDTICSGSIVEFEAVDQGFDPVTYEWSFGAGSNPSIEVGAGAHEVTYTYNAENGSTGAWVILTMGTPGCSNVTDTVANVHVNANPNSAISFTPAGNPCVLVSKTFQPAAAEVPGYTYSWNFGAGASIPTANTYGPHVVEYYTAGAKTVQLIVFSNEQGASCGDTSTVTITVNLCPGNITGKVMKTDGTGISGVNVRLYADQDLNGIQDNSTIIRSVFTAATGVYSMATITPGYYVIVEIQPLGYLNVSDLDTSEDFDSLTNLNVNDNIIPVTVEPGELDADNIFTEVPSPGVITGFVFEDYDNNQAPAPIEGLPAITIDLFTDTNSDGKADPGGYVESVITSSTGAFIFESVINGNYVITEHHPDNYNSVKDFDTSNDGDIVPNTNMVNDTIPLTITNNEIDAGNYFIESSVCSRLVTTVQDNVPGSLRYMLACASENDTIRFHPLLADQTLVLNAGRIEIEKNFYILSDVTPKITIHSNVSGGFKLIQGKTLELKNLDIESGLSGFPGAAFENYGHLILWDISVLKNVLLPPTDPLIYNGLNGILTLKGVNFIETE